VDICIIAKRPAASRIGRLIFQILVAAKKSHDTFPFHKPPDFFTTSSSSLLQPGQSVKRQLAEYFTTSPGITAVW
jgi:hypothetical protein